MGESELSVHRQMSKSHSNNPCQWIRPQSSFFKQVVLVSLFFPEVVRKRVHHIFNSQVKVQTSIAIFCACVPHNYSPWTGAPSVRHASMSAAMRIRKTPIQIEIIVLSCYPLYVEFHKFQKIATLVSDRVPSDSNFVNVLFLKAVYIYFYYCTSFKVYKIKSPYSIITSLLNFLKVQSSISFN